MQDWCKEIKKNIKMSNERIHPQSILSCDLFSFEELMCETSLKCDYCSNILDIAPSHTEVDSIQTL